jgi:hypothetical protein
MSVDIKTLTAQLAGKGVEFNEIIRKASPILPILFYDPADLYLGTGSDLKPKELQKTRYISSSDRTLEWRDVDLRPTNATTTSTVSAAATTIPVNDGTLFSVGNQIYCRTNRETYTVTAISTNDLTVTPAVAVEIASGDTIVKVSHSIGEGGDGEGVSISASAAQTNYVQDTSKKLTFNETTLNKLYQYFADMGMNEDKIISNMVSRYINEAKSKIFHDIANAFYVGQKKTGTVGGATRYYAGGFTEYYTTNTDCTGTSAINAWTKIQDALRPIQELDTGTGMNDIVLVTTNKGAQALSNLVFSGNLDIVRESQTINVLGAQVTSLRTIAGDIRVVVDPTLADVEGDTANVAYAFKPGMVRMVSYPYNMTVLDVKKNEAKQGIYEGITLFAKPQQNVNSAEIEVFTNFSFVFGGNTVNAGVRLSNLGVHA